MLVLINFVLIMLYIYNNNKLYINTRNEELSDTKFDMVSAIDIGSNLL
jgi:hypothetical protein